MSILTRPAAALALGLCLTLLWCGGAGPSIAAAPAAAAPAPQAAGHPPSVPPSAATPPLDCQASPPGGSPPNTTQLSVTVDNGSLWTPRGGDLKFTLSGAGAPFSGAEMITCFQWSNLLGASGPDGKPGKAPWLAGGAPRTLSTAGGPVAYAATVVGGLDEPLFAPLERFVGFKADKDSAVLGLVPMATLRVLVRPPAAAGQVAPAWYEASAKVGVSSPLGALVVGILAVVLGGVFVYICGRLRGVPEAGDPILQLIADPDGYASLSQFQILLWSFVVGGASVYVMVLTGNLVNITDGTAALLGISGVAVLGAKLSGATAPPASSGPVPPAVLARVEAFAEGGDVRLYWGPPQSGSADRYRVSYQTAAGLAAGRPWIVATDTLRGRGMRVVGLDPATDHVFEVRGVNENGAGPAVTATATTGPADPGIALGGGISLAAPATNTRLAVTWNPAAVPALYRLSYRAHDGDDGWTEAPVTGQGGVLAGLAPETRYDVRVVAAASGPAGVWGPPLVWTVSTCGPRRPLWSDLVMAGAGSAETEVTRVQMLFFTVIAAVFVVVRVLAAGQIPDIPAGFLVVMGISNGVYLTSKFVRSA